MLSDMEPGHVISIEQVDRLSRLNDAAWEILRKEISDKRLSVVSLDPPRQPDGPTNAVTDDFTRSMLKAVNGTLLGPSDVGHHSYIIVLGIHCTPGPRCGPGGGVRKSIHTPLGPHPFSSSAML